jgi:hypothetical protein
MYNFQAVDSAQLFRKKGLEVWGCSNIGPFFRELSVRYRDCLANARDWWRYGDARGCKGLLMTSWLCPTLSAELNVLGNAAAADLWQASPKASLSRMLENGLTRLYGREAVAARPVIETMERYPLVGYWAWRIYSGPLANVSTLEPVGTLDRMVGEIAQARRIAEKRSGVPAVIRETAKVREYYTLKQRLARCGSRCLFQARQAYQVGNSAQFQRDLETLESWVGECQAKVPVALKATKALWKRSRPICSRPAKRRPSSGS